MEKIYKIESYIKQIVAKFPERGQLSLKRKYYAWQIKNNRFFSPEPEFNLLSQWVSRNDWVIDVGANIGHYTKKFQI